MAPAEVLFCVVTLPAVAVEPVGYSAVGCIGSHEAGEQ